MPMLGAHERGRQLRRSFGSIQRFNEAQKNAIIRSNTRHNIFGLHRFLLSIVIFADIRY
jgi:hypothetical protein